MKKEKQKSSSKKDKSKGPSNLNLYLGLICAGFAFLLYANTLNHEYALDDFPTIYGNHLTMDGVKSIPTLFKTAYWFGLDGKNDWLYRPLSMAMFATEWQIAPNTPALSHWINVLLYALSGFLLFNFLKDLFKNNSIIFPFAISLLWIAHPIHTEVVANIKSRDEILAFLFCILTLHQSLKYINSDNIKHLILAALFYFPALLAKETPITMMGILPLTLFVFTDASYKKIALSLIPLGISAAVYLVIRGFVLTSQIGDHHIALIDNTLVGAPDFIHRQATAFYILGYYIKLLFLPYPMSSDYSFKAFEIVGFDNLFSLLSIIAHFALGVYAVIRIFKKDPVAYGILFYLIIMSLVSNVLFLSHSTAADRFLYMSSLGFCIIIVVLLSKIFKADIFVKKDFPSLKYILSYNKYFTYAVCILLIFASLKTIGRNPDWKNDTTLYAADINHTPKSARLHFLYANHLFQEITEGKTKSENIEADIAESIKHFNIALELNPKYREPNMLLGYVYNYKNNYPEALKHFRIAISNEPDFSNAWSNLGYTYYKMQQYDTAIVYLQKAIQIEPSSYEAHSNLGSCYFSKGDYESAISAFNKSIEANPNFVDAYKNLGSAYGMLKQYDQSISNFLKALELQPNNIDINKLLGLTYQFKGDQQSADFYLQKSQQLSNGSKR